MKEKKKTEEVMFEILLPPTTHREALLRVGSLPRAPIDTFNRGMAQHVVFDCFGLAQLACCEKPLAKTLIDF